MKIGYDSNSSQNIQGTGTYANNLIRELTNLDNNLNFIEFDYLKFYEQMKFKDRILKFTMRKMFMASGDPYWEWYKVPKLGKEKEIDVYHSMGGCVPRSVKFKTVQSVLDLAYFYFPEYLEQNTVRYFKTWFKFSAKSADTIIAISQSTKNDIIKFWKIPEEKIHVIYLGVSQEFFKKKGEVEISSVLTKYSIPEEYLLFVSELNYRKNLHTLIRSFGIFKKENKECKLVLAGKPQKSNYIEEIHSLIDKLNLKNEVIITDRVSKEELLCLYQGATAFVFPTLYEGFGFPVLESMASGTPVISSNTSSIPEIVGDAGVLVNPMDERGITKAIFDIVQDSNLRRTLAEKGKARAETFTWQKSAKRTLELYHDILM